MKNLQFLLGSIECKAPHPITCINPDEWFTPIDIRSSWDHSDGEPFIRGENTAWFHFDQCEVRNKVELPDAGELESWRSCATELRATDQKPHAPTIRRGAMLLENAYLFANKLIKDRL